MLDYVLIEFNLLQHDNLYVRLENSDREPFNAARRYT